MRNILKILIGINLIIASIGVKAQVTPKNSCKIEGDRLVFSYNLNWTDEQKKEFVDLFDIDSSVIGNIKKGIPEFVANGVVWKAKKTSSSIVVFSKTLNDGSAVQQSVDNIKLQAGITEMHQEGTLFANYGVNRFQNDDAFSYKNGVAQFFLPNHSNARKVMLSGSFNSWSTMKTPMQKVDNGWVISIKLQPGKYTYKYIVDGRWLHDPSNKLKERNEHSSYNSVVFCYNYTFTLNEYPNARKVVLAGSFNNWNPNELQLVKTMEGWKIPMFLREGTHTYKFIVDNNWILDPNNKISRPDGRGNTNSSIGIGNIYKFKLKGFLNAKKIYIAGTFNAWNPDELLMERATDGWALPYRLGSGNYEYKFIVDGQWITDPENPVTIGSGDVINSVLSVNPNYTFKVGKFLNAKTVIISGNFNGWSRDGYRMEKTSNGWILPVYLKPGKYIYKLIVDGEWMLDPENNLWEQNEFGNGNSVLWVNY